MYEDLKILISDCRNVGFYTEEFYSIVRPVVLLQVAVCSGSLITSSYFISLQFLTYSMDFAKLLQFIVCFILYAIQLFMYTYMLDSINEKRDCINFGLYSSDWTSMDIRFKKLLLLAMQVNSATSTEIQATPNKLMNLELFLSVLRVSYNIVSFMLNVKMKSSADK
ncbi:uncharacterized protein LOC126844863 [Adelges cooleyi]|uniref:uncharacterized protein LOC126844863 n=1 Tax=Adelges cooleyi TaxID=133065 RepID=UPI0021803E45|nr:uncharacterized protein LOC126844863 [Adelges cooleyi]